MEQLLVHPVNLDIYPALQESQWMLFQYRDTRGQLNQLQNPLLHLVSTGPAP